MDENNLCPSFFIVNNKGIVKNFNNLEDARTQMLQLHKENGGYYQLIKLLHNPSNNWFLDKSQFMIIGCHIKPCNKCECNISHENLK